MNCQLSTDPRSGQGSRIPKKTGLLSPLSQSTLAVDDSMDGSNPTPQAKTSDGMAIVNLTNSRSTQQTNASPARQQHGNNEKQKTNGKSNRLTPGKIIAVRVKRMYMQASVKKNHEESQRRDHEIEHVGDLGIEKLLLLDSNIKDDLGLENDADLSSEEPEMILDATRPDRMPLGECFVEDKRYQPESAAFVDDSMELDA